MGDSTVPVTRREMLIAGTGTIAALTALANGTLPALAHSTQITHHTAMSDDSTWKKVAAVFGVNGMVEPGDVLLIDLPRTDLSPSVMGISLKPDFGFDSEITFQHIDQGAIAKWELTLLDSEVTPVLDALFAGGLKPSTTNLNALHNHFLELDPKIKYLHGTAVGDPVQIARALRHALEQSAQPFTESSPGDTGLPNKQITHIIGGTSRISDSVLTVDVERQETIHELGIRLEPAMQVESMFNFQSIGGGQAAVNGEFVLIAPEMDVVARTLRSHGFLVMAVHNHELFVQPTLYYLHSFATGAPLDLAHAIRDALNKTNSKFM